MNQVNRHRQKNENLVCPPAPQLFSWCFGSREDADRYFTKLAELARAGELKHAFIVRSESVHSVAFAHWVSYPHAFGGTGTPAPARFGLHSVDYGILDYDSYVAQSRVLRVRERGFQPFKPSKPQRKTQPAKPVDTTNWPCCPHCGSKVKAKNLQRHIQRAHPEKVETRKVPCGECGAPILPQAAEQTDGVCKVCAKKRDSRCFVATACYGACDCAEVYTLRTFRDEVLQQNSLGILLTQAYYVVSPPFARWLDRNPAVSGFVRRSILNPLVGRLQSRNKSMPNKPPGHVR